MSLNIILIFIGGGAGAVLRYITTKLVSPLTQSVASVGNASFLSQLPLATFIVNIFGSFLIGMSLHMTDSPLKKLLVVGFLGGFTTFSAFSAENLQLVIENKYITAFLYALLSVSLGFIGCAVGWLVGAKI